MVLACHRVAQWIDEGGGSLCGCIFNDRWWLYNDTTVKAMTPPPTRDKRRFRYTSGNKQIWLYQACRSLPPNGQPLVRHGMPRAYLLTPRCQPWRWHQMRPPPSPPSTQGAARVGYRKDRPMHAQGVPLDASVPAMALARGAPAPSPCATQSASRVGDRNMSMHAQSMPDEMCVAASAPLQTSSEFVEAVAQLLQKRKVRVARHLRVRVEAH